MFEAFPERQLNAAFMAGSAADAYRPHMFNIFEYEFGYSWPIAYGFAIPLAIGIALAAVATWRRWRAWVTVVSAVVIVWSAAALYVTNVVWGINKPMTLPTERFLQAGSGRVLDAGAGSGRAAVGVLLARPGATVTALDIYDGYMGIDDNTPARFMKNAQIAGAADRADVRTGDARQMPFADASFDAVVSSYMIDHLGREGRTKALHEVARVLKAHGEFLLLIVNTDWWTWLVSPPMAHHFRPDAARWRAELHGAGFDVEEEGHQPVTLYWLARKSKTPNAQLPTTQNQQ
ncbi:MAG TPA: class I SAM-dependent methyltransferase [Vicinamibacterales bacterium]|nr:class I SAM-dependent methyltransferase [Vicinamibacterales bacterium]